MRALHREPAQLERVASLLDVLRKAPGSSELLSDDFQKVWNPIWDAARQDDGEMTTRPDTASVLAGLKDFQRATVDYVFDGFTAQTRRNDSWSQMRWVSVRPSSHAASLRERLIIFGTTLPRIDVIYICSNTDIARQNVQRLGIPGCEDAAQATRLTLIALAIATREMTCDKHRVNFVALTPATSFEQTGGGGRMDERVLLYWLLDRAWGIHGSRASLYVMQDYASATSSGE